MIPTAFDIARRDSEADRSARRRSAAVADAFRPAKSGLDFGLASAPANPSSGTANSFADIYGSTAFKADIVRRDAQAARLDRLPAKVQRLATERGVADIDLLTVVGAVVAKADIMGRDARVQIFASDLGKAMAITTQRAEALLAEACREGFLQSYSGGYFASKL